MEKDLIYQIAITQIPGVGGVTARKLISYCGGVEPIFREKLASLKKIPGVGEALARAVYQHRCLERAEKEVAFLKKHGIKARFYLDDDYPFRLKQCEDAPLLLFTKGEIYPNHPRILSIVGTRKITSYGREQCEALVHDLVPYNPLIISGLAYGVDACAHETALQNNLNTVAVLGHGLDRIYPSLHHKLAKKMLTKGGLMSDFLSGTRPDRENFPRRNRIIAGLCDAVIVIEAAVTGGALITANVANTYNRDVFALPGRTTDIYSQGCNKLIKINKAHLIESVADIQYIMNWEKGTENKKGRQTSLFVSLSEEEKILVAYLKERREAGIDQLVTGTGFNLSKTTSVLLNLEFKGVVKPLPGKIFRLQATI